MQTRANFAQNPKDMTDVSHDFQIRARLKKQLCAAKQENDLVVDEFSLSLGEVRADVALINGHLEGFEIKAEKDTLLRLPTQVKVYNHIFDFATVVTTKSHLNEVRRIVPKWWGILEAIGGQDQLKARRAPKPNPEQSGIHLARLLWRQEALDLLETKDLLKGVKSKPKIVLYQVIADSVPLSEISHYVRQCLKARKDWRVAPEQSGRGDSLHRDATA